MPAYYSDDAKPAIAGVMMARYRGFPQQALTADGRAIGFDGHEHD